MLCVFLHMSVLQKAHHRSHSALAGSTLSCRWLRLNSNGPTLHAGPVSGALCCTWWLAQIGKFAPVDRIVQSCSPTPLPAAWEGMPGVQQERISRHQARDPHRPALCVPQMAAGFQVRACSCKQPLRSQHPACWLPLVAMGCSTELKLSVKQPGCWLCQPSLQLCCFQGLVASEQCRKSQCDFSVVFMPKF